jgi:hypothetical protein
MRGCVDRSSVSTVTCRCQLQVAGQLVNLPVGICQSASPRSAVLVSGRLVRLLCQLSANWWPPRPIWPGPPGSGCSPVPRGPLSRQRPGGRPASTSVPPSLQGPVVSLCQRQLQWHWRCPGERLRAERAPWHRAPGHWPAPSDSRGFPTLGPAPWVSSPPHCPLSLPASGSLRLRTLLCHPQPGGLRWPSAVFPRRAAACGGVPAPTVAVLRRRGRLGAWADPIRSSLRGRPVRADSEAVGLPRPVAANLKAPLSTRTVTVAGKCQCPTAVSADAATRSPMRRGRHSPRRGSRRISPEITELGIGSQPGTG